MSKEEETMTASTSAGMNAVDVYAGELRDAEDAVGRCFDVNEDMARVIAVAAEGAAAAIERCDGFGRDGFGRGRCGRRSQHANQHAIPFTNCERNFTDAKHNNQPFGIEDTKSHQ